jgi:hypothetical protein
MSVVAESLVDCQLVALVLTLAVAEVILLSGDLAFLLLLLVLEAAVVVAEMV